MLQIDGGILSATFSRLALDVLDGYTFTNRTEITKNAGLLHERYINGGK